MSRLKVAGTNQKESNMNKSILKKLSALLAILVVAGGVQTFTSCSSDDGDENSSSASANAGTSSSSAGQPTSYSGSYGSLTDSRDNKTYKTVQIGTQTWMAENLNYNAPGSKCHDDNPDNCVTYGRLYNWKMAMNSCPTGWHLPSYAEWNVLTAYVGGEKTEGKKLKTTSGWNRSGNGTDEYGFSALPGGKGYNVSLSSIGSNSGWWITRESLINSDAFKAYYRSMTNNNESASWDTYEKDILLSVRCLQDSGEDDGSSSSITQGNDITYGSLTDSRDNKIYKTVQIGAQTWMAENLNYDAEDSKCYDDNLYGCAKYGRLYNWSTAMGFASSCNSNICSSLIQTKHQGICPDGWHIPSDGDWEELLRFVDSENDGKRDGDGEPYTSRTAGKYLKEKSDWIFCGPYTYPPWCSEDTYGFSALPAGIGFSDGVFEYVGKHSSWQGTREYSNYYIYTWQMDDFANVYQDTKIGYHKNSFLSVRCIQG
jgi:uncharacterized protein (TIGR02145 family)